MNNKPINRIERADVEAAKREFTWPEIARIGALDRYQQIATKSAIYPGKGTPFGLMYVALGLAEAGEVQNKVKKAFRDDDIIEFVEYAVKNSIGDGWAKVRMHDIPPERRAKIIKELGGALWYIAAVCNEINATMSEVALANLEELCDRGERGTLQGDGDER